MLATAEGREVVVNRLAGEAVLKGAHVFSPGLLAASAGLAAGDTVALTVALEKRPG
jgi:predicted ribosome-associated RNA-binding protein Tma20